jgi:hypothetical protein
VDFSKGSSQALMSHQVKKKLKEREGKKKEGWGGGVLVDLATCECEPDNINLTIGQNVDFAIWQNGLGKHIK